MSAELAKEMQCEVEEVSPYKVCLADRKQLRSSVKCRNVKLSVEEEQFTIDALILPLYDYDLILGMQWLEPLEKVSWNFKNRTLSFMQQSV